MVRGLDAGPPKRAGFLSRRDGNLPAPMRRASGGVGRNRDLGPGTLRCAQARRIKQPSSWPRFRSGRSRRRPRASRCRAACSR